VDSLLDRQDGVITMAQALHHLPRTAVRQRIGTGCWQQPHRPALVTHSRLPEPSRQVVRRDAGGRRRYLDTLFQQWGVHVEIDGGQHLEPRHA
jgi:hypothetical protein